MPQTKIKALIETASEEIISKQIALALKGHPVGRFLIERLVPIARSSPIESPVDLQGTRAQQAEVILTALASAQITQDDASSLLNALRVVEEITSSAEIMERLRDIESRLARLAIGGTATKKTTGGEDASS